MITASHNPPADNGYKLYLGDGAQIVPPVDAQIETAIRELGPLSGAVLGPPDGPLITQHGSEIAEAYLTAVVGAAPSRGGDPPDPPDRRAAPSGGKPPRLSAGLPPVAPPGADLQVVYTPLHGVAGSLMLQAIERAGYPAPHVVAAQAQPDPGFPTVSFPNPEEPGALDLALAEAARLGADLVLASDPDGDRLAVAVPDPAADGGWRALTGDQVGSLLGAYLLDVTTDSPDAQRRLVASTVVSSVMLASIAAAVGVKYVETLTGFKWIVRAADDQPGRRFVFGYEEALGYAVGDVVRDKDGIGAALALLSLASRARADGQGLLDRWDALEAAHGVHLRAQLTVPTRAPGEIMAGLRAAPPADLAAQPVLDVTDLADGGPLPPSDVLIFRLLGSRVVVRPSGTEPKLKCYLEVVEPVTGDGLPAARARAAARLDPLRAGISALLN
jgi:phosphomannomutase